VQEQEKHSMTMSTTSSTTDAPGWMVARICYGLHAVGLVLGAFGAATVLGSFLFGWPSIIAVILNYIYRGSAKGTWVESHYTWQIRTFWYALLWAVLVALVSIPLTIIVIGIGTWIVGMALLGIWAIYRIARGWIKLEGRQPMPV
jgi:uncharacterized membrane protein